MAEDAELLRRAEDLRMRCERSSLQTNTHFLTPAEQYKLEKWAMNRADCRMVITCGIENTDRKPAFFLPDWAPDDEPDLSVLSALQITAGFGEPGHRDYLGAILALGIKREWLGDIMISGNAAYVLCMETVCDTLLYELDHVGKYGVKLKKVDLSEVPVPERKTKSVTFTVQSSRFDTVVSGMFSISRTIAAKMIREGLASLNYEECLKPDKEITEGDIISLRGYGKGKLAVEGGQSRKGRTFLTAEIWM